MDFVEKGGTWIVGPMSDILKDNAVKYNTAPYSFLEDFAGVYTQMQIPMETDEIKAVWKDGTALPVEKTFDAYTLNGAESLADYTSSYVKGLSVIAQKQVGKGKVIVVGSVISGADMLRLIGMQPILKASDNVELTQRGDYVIAMEIENQEGTIELPEVYRDILTDKTYSGQIAIGAFSVMVLKKEPQ